VSVEYNPVGVRDRSVQRNGFGESLSEVDFLEKLVVNGDLDRIRGVVPLHSGQTVVGGLRVDEGVVGEGDGQRFTGVLHRGRVRERRGNHTTEGEPADDEHRT
jgi:hypothetical protein